MSICGGATYLYWRKLSNTWTVRQDGMTIARSAHFNAPEWFQVGPCLLGSLSTAFNPILQCLPKADVIFSSSADIVAETG